MFEKEAEEYAEGTKTEKELEVLNTVQDWGQESLTPEERILLVGIQDRERAREQGFIAGAEFGYNKANEWHYVKDGDLPKAYQKCYFIYSNTYGEGNKVIFPESNINVLTGIYAFFLDEETDEETTEPCFYDDINDDEIDLSEVYAWKEIVLPELKESE